MSRLLKINKELEKSLTRASQVLIEYEYWLRKRYNASPAYLTNAKSFLRSYKQGGDVKAQLEDYMSAKGPSLRSILNRLLLFLEGRKFVYLINDLNEPKPPLSNPFVKLFLISNQDRLRTKGSMSIYATILNAYFLSIKDDVTRINKRTANKYILSPALSDYTKRLYKSVLKAFCEWAYMYQALDPKDLSREQKLVRNGLKKISAQSLREIIGIKVILPRSLSATYHKDSLTEKQRRRLLKLAKSPRDKAILTLMSWNGLRSIEVLRLTVGDIKYAQGKLLVWGKGKSEKSKDIIKLSSTTKKELMTYLKKTKIRRGKLFQNLSRTELDNMIHSYFRKLRVRGRFTPHSLRHTAGQLMYSKNIPLELIQKTLRHADMRTTMIYAQKAIDQSYFKRLRRF